MPSFFLFIFRSLICLKKPIFIKRDFPSWKVLTSLLIDWLIYFTFYFSIFIFISFLKNLFVPLIFSFIFMWDVQNSWRDFFEKLYFLYFQKKGTNYTREKKVKIKNKYTLISNELLWNLKISKNSYVEFINIKAFLSWIHLQN